MTTSTLVNTNQFEGLNWNRFNSSMIIEIKRGGHLFTSTAVAIGRNMLLTAAHSVDCFDEGHVYLGANYNTSTSAIKISKTIVHPGYNPGKSFYENDLAIVILEHNLPKDIHIENLDSSIAIDCEDSLERIGFGGRDNENFRTWTTPKFKTSTYNKNNFVLEDHNSVIGDSGGPIYKNENGKLKLVGIHSTLDGTDTTYIVNVNKYLEWIGTNKMLRSLN
jgi:secreted trypsin-like serine protease